MFGVLDFVAVEVDGEECLDEEVFLEFDSGVVDGEVEDLEDPGDDLKEVDPVTGTKDEDDGVGGIGVVEGDGVGGGGFVGGSTQQDAPTNNDYGTGMESEEKCVREGNGTRES